MMLSLNFMLSITDIKHFCTVTSGIWRNNFELFIWIELFEDFGRWHKI